MNTQYKIAAIRKLDKLEQHIDVKAKPGIYIFLNALNEPVLYVGRSDTSLKRRLDSWRRNQKRNYTYYTFIQCDTIHESYWLECFFYHKYNPSLLDNKIHPQTPKGFNLVSPCPVCGYRTCLNLDKNRNS